MALPEARLHCGASLDGYFVSLNPTWAARLGWTDAEMGARPFLDFVHPDDVGATMAAAGGLARGEAQITFENRYWHRDGRYLWLSWNAVPRDGLIYASVRDVTAIKDQAEASHKPRRRCGNRGRRRRSGN